jgi:hypothetical protein
MTDPAFILALVAAVLGATSLVLHVVAPRTKNTIDDKVRDDIDEVLAFIRGRTPPAAPPADTATKLTSLTLVLLAAGIVASTQSSCATVKAAPAIAEHAVVDCVRADQAPIIALVVQLAADALTYVLSAGAVDWGALESAAWAQGEVTGGCALAEFVHGVSSKATSVRTLGGSIDPALAALERLRVRAGGVRWQTPAGVL